MSRAAGAQRALELLRPGRHPRAGEPARRLSAPALGRPAPARHDRHGAGQRARPADRRRADDRARRHHPGADPEAAEGAAGAARHGDAADHPRPHHRAQDRRPGLRHDRRRDRRAAADVRAIFERPQHAYTRHLLAAEPKGGRGPAPADAPPMVMRADDVKVWFPIKRGVLRRTVGYVKAVDGIDARGARRARRWASSARAGSGKTTLGLALLRLMPSDGAHRASPASAIQGLGSRRAAAAAARDADRLPGPLRQPQPAPVGRPDRRRGPARSTASAATRDERRELIGRGARGGRPRPGEQDRYPHEFSGGQRQRIAIARAMVLQAALRRARRADLGARHVGAGPDRRPAARRCRRGHDLAYLFISHDLRVVRALAHEVHGDARRQGRRAGPAEPIFDAPKEAYTRALMAAAFELRPVEDGAPI